MDLRDQLQKSLGDTYSLERELGGGGMSRVFIASENALGRRVVVKVVSPELAGGVSIDRFKREIALAARLQHPHIVPLLTAGDAGGIPYFTMPYVEGQALRARLARDGELPIAEGVRILREIASALDYAHECNVVHRDIKPDNVLLSRGSAMVTDFGVAKALSSASNGDEGGVTSIGVALGTPAYMAPEQAAASPNVDARADIYAWGIMAYEMFAGRAPFAGRSPQAMLAAHVTEPPEPITKLRPNLPSGLASLIMRCLEKHAADRPQKAAELIHTLDTITTPSGGSEPTSAQPATQARPRKPSNVTRNVAIAAAASFFLVIVAVVILRPRASALGPNTNDLAPSKSIAVLPFVNASGDPKDEYFADGIADELTTALAIPGLRVMSRSSAFAFKGKGLSAKQVGDSLHVTSVLEGQVRRAGDRVRITAQLVNVADGMTAWSHSYDRDIKDVLAVQEEIARSIAGGLKLAYAPASSRLESGGTKNPAAHDLYLKGLFETNQRTKPTLERAIQYFKQAIARDSGYALAYVGLADAYKLAAEYAGLLNQETLRLAEAAARKALTIDSTLAEAHVTLGATYGDRFQWEEGEREFLRAIALKPDYARAYHWYVNNLLRPMRRFDSAEVVIKKAIELDPMLPALVVNHAINLVAMNRAPEAIAFSQEVVKRFPDSWIAHVRLGYSHLAAGEYDKAEAATKTALALQGTDAVGLQLAVVYARMGRRSEADSIIRLAESRSRTARVRPIDLASAYVALGNKDKAFEHLTRAIETNDASNFHASFQLDPLREDPRYKALLKKARLAP